MKIPILATGLSGLVGTRVNELLSGYFEFNDLSLDTGIDITNGEDLTRAIENSKASTILHMAAKTDVDSCEDDKILQEEGLAWQVNVIGTENIVEVARRLGKRVIYISTDFVFDGSKDSYREKDLPNPVNWYGYTKFLGERSVLETLPQSTVLRIAYPYRANFSLKKDFVRNILTKLHRQEIILGITDHIFTPTFIDDIATAVGVFIKKDLPGIYHVVGSQSLTTYEAIKLIAQTFNLKANIKKIDRKTYFKDRAFRPFKLALNNDKISSLGIEMRSFDEGLREVKKQLDRRDDLRQ